MISDWELWACAQQAIRQHGAKAAGYAAQRVAVLEEAADDAGVKTWKAIATRVEQLSDLGGARQGSGH